LNGILINFEDATQLMAVDIKRIANFMI
jgi:hypothetical protein